MLNMNSELFLDRDTEIANPQSEQSNEGSAKSPTKNRKVIRL